MIPRRQVRRIGTSRDINGLRTEESKKKRILSGAASARIFRANFKCPSRRWSWSNAPAYEGSGPYWLRFHRKGTE
jgi:hypothetical protein